MENSSLVLAYRPNFHHLPALRYIDVILPLPLDTLFTYSIADTLAVGLQAGVRVTVPLGRTKTYTGIFVEWHEQKPDFEVKEVIGVLDSKPVLLPEQLRLWQWISSYYMSPLGDVYKAALPAGLKLEEVYKPRRETYVGLPASCRNARSLHLMLDVLRRAQKQLQVFSVFLSLSHWATLDENGNSAPIAEVTREELLNETHCNVAIIKALCDRGFLTVYEKEVGRIGTAAGNGTVAPHPLSAAQGAAYKQLLQQMMHKNVVLLHGVTSSGKTEIYIHLIEKTLRERRQVLYLLPEIALTVQITSRLKRVFGHRLGIYHSRYSDAERVEIWQKQLSDQPFEVILGARSAVFLPFQRLGLVIIDEEHETSFKQQDPAPRYHARSAAIMLARMYDGCKVLLGTATPSAESYYNALHGKYGLVTLSTRYAGIELPEVRIVDVKDLQRRKMMNGPFSPDLLAAVRQALTSGRQVILFQNRRGFAPMVECKVCGWVPKCTHCDVTLTLHKRLNQLTCHYCGYSYPLPKVCPCCGSEELITRGFGTENVENRLREIFPEARIARMDLDTTRSRNAYSRIIDDFSAGRTNVLIGTQMVSKGLDFGGVSVVGILNADSMLNYPDFRAYEHAFTMMAQVSGRAGRKGGRGLVMLQTKSADLSVIHEVVTHDYDGFFRSLMEERRNFHYPPFYHLIYVYLRHHRDDITDTAAVELGSRLRQIFGDRVLGPDKPAVARVKNMCIRKIVLKLENGLDATRVRNSLKAAEHSLLSDKRYASLQVYYDVDPL